MHELTSYVLSQASNRAVGGVDLALTIGVVDLAPSDGVVYLTVKWARTERWEIQDQPTMYILFWGTFPPRIFAHRGTPLTTPLCLTRVPWTPGTPSPSEPPVTPAPRAPSRSHLEEGERVAEEPDAVGGDYDPGDTSVHKLLVFKRVTDGQVPGETGSECERTGCQCERTGSSVREQEVGVREPEVRELKVSVRELEVSVREQEVGVRQQEVGVRELEVSVREPEVCVRGPEVGVREPEVSANLPFDGHEEKIKDGGENEGPVYALAVPQLKQRS